MILREVIPTLFACLYLSPTGPAQENFPDLLPLARPPAIVQPPDFSKTVIPITELKLHGLGQEADFGTGFCLDLACCFIGTNYHVATLARPRKIKGETVIQRYVATGPDDEGATLNDSLSVGPMKYNLSRDLAIFEFRHPLPHYHGAIFNLDDLQLGQQVEIYSFPKEAINPIRKLLQFHGTFNGQTTTGLLAFDYGSSAGKAIRPGASCGIVVDAKTQQIVGVLRGTAKNGEAPALAVPIHSLTEFVSMVQPFLAQSLFPTAAEGISPVSLDLFPKFVPPPSFGTLHHRPEESPDIKVPRSKAQLLANSMRNFIAVQTFAWGTGNKVPAAVSAYDYQVFSSQAKMAATDQN